MSNPIAEFLRSKEDRNRLLKIEQLRRQGEKFIKVRYTGNIRPRVDNEGICYNLRFHGLKDLEAYEETDINTGGTVWKGRKGARVLVFHQSVVGDIEADVWDDPDHWNRRFIATHPEDLYVTDNVLREEIKEELKRPFKAEFSRKEELEKEIADKVQELENINQADKTTGKRYNKKKKSGTGEDIDGLDKSAFDVDSSGMSRMAT
jgi:hypothetical protein